MRIEDFSPEEWRVFAAAAAQGMVSGSLPRAERQTVERMMARLQERFGWVGGDRIIPAPAKPQRSGD